MNCLGEVLNYRKNGVKVYIQGHCSSCLTISKNVLLRETNSFCATPSRLSVGRGYCFVVRSRVIVTTL